MTVALVLFALASLAELVPGIHATVDLSGGIGARASADSGARSVSIRYVTDVEALVHLVDATVRYDVSISPRALVWVDEHTLCVGGVEWSDGEPGEPGATVIELWSFTSPRLVPGPRDRARIEPGARTDVRTLYRADVPGLRGVRELVLRGGNASPAVLARFEDSSDLWSIELDELGRMRRQAGPINSGAPVVAPLLAREGVRMDARPADDGGVLYVLSVPSCIVSPDDPVGLLWDRDGDGVIDLLIERIAQL